MISKELLDEVIEYETKPIYESNGILYYMRDEFQSDVVGYMMVQRNINIYELMNMMKEWAWKNKKQIVSSMVNEDRNKEDESVLWYASCTAYYEKALDGMYDKSEPDAVTKVCEWILNEQT